MLNPKKLKEFGLNEKEAAVYIALLELGEAKAQEIAKKARVVRPAVYDVLNRLKEDGLVGTINKGKVAYFVANSPDTIKRNLEDKQKSFDQLLPELKSVFNTTKTKPKILFYEGIEGVKTVFEDTLTTRDKTLLGILSMEDLFKDPGKNYMDDYVRRRVKLGHTLRVIRSKPKEVASIWPTSAEEGRELRNPPENMVFEMTTYIYDDKVGLISTEKENFGMIIESKEFSQNMRHLFEALWQISTPP
jgi:sugar-specific transcriptional regulator TrmB